MTGAISAHDFWFNWFTWWVGDATGAMLLAPVLLSLSVKHGEIWKLRRTSVALPLCILLFLMVFLYVFVSHKEQQRIENEFKLKAELIASQINEEWAAHLDALYSEVGFFSAYSQVDRDKFRVFARFWLARHRGIQALEWIPRVLHAERSRYEEAARRDGRPDFRITERTEQGLLVERTPQPEYFPVYYVDPYEGNEIALGFDLSSDKNRMSALNQALVTGKPVGTSRITLVQEKAGQYGFLVFMPVYDRKTSNLGERELRDAIRGFALGVFRIGDAMRVVVGEAETQGIQIQLTDLTADQGEQLLYDSMPTTPARDDSKTASRSVTTVAPWLATSLEIAERHWRLSFSPTADYLAEHRSLQAWSVLAGGLIFAAGACAFLLVVTGRAARIEVLVSERTNALEMEITEHKRAEEALQESEARLKIAMDLANLMQWEYDVKTGMFSFDEQFYGLYGPASRDEGGPLMTAEAYARKFIPPEKSHLVAEEIAKALASADPNFTHQLEHRIMRADGEERHIIVRYGVVCDQTGRVVKIQGSNQDVTERKRAAEALHASEQRLADIIDFLPDATFAINSEGIVIAWNRAIEEMTGIPKSKMIGKGDFEYSLPFYGSRRPVLIDLVFASEAKKIEYYDSVSTIGDAIVVETYVPKTYGGKGAYLWGVATALFDEQGNISGAIESIRDITVRKRAEEALRESETKLQAIFNTVGTGIFIIDRDTQNIIEANQTAVEMTGLPKERIVGQSCHLLVCPVEVGKCPVKDLGQKVDHSERKLIHAGGQSKDILKTVYPVTINGRDCYVESFIDITDRKRAEADKEKLEAQLFHSQKMESIGRLAGGVAHDFNNMLGVIIGRAELALNAGVPTDELRHNLQEILKAGLRSAELTRQLLAFARKQIAVPKILDLNDTISSMLKMLRRLIGEDIELLWIPELDLWKVKMDPSQVDQILANLAVNSRDAISGVGAITMRTENVVIDDSVRAETPEFIPGEYVLLTVSDTGAGMSKEVCENIFEPFFTTKEVGKGTGLGLSTVYGIVKQNEGFIYVASEPGKGTTFKIYLPRFEVQIAQAPYEDAAGKHPTGTETILLVEDDEPILNLGRVILENLGYTVIAASAPEQAIHLVENHPGDIHLLITDVVMPGMNGRELAERLGAIRPNLKRLYMSGYTADLIAHRGILDERVNFIQKPFGSDELAARVRQVLDQLE